MSFASRHPSISVADYLRGEQLATRKHEYVEGMVYAMMGATNVHNRIATNATVALGMQLRGRRSQVFNSDTQVRFGRREGLAFITWTSLSSVSQILPVTRFTMLR